MMSKNSIVPFLKDYLIKFLTRPFLLDTNELTTIFSTLQTSKNASTFQLKRLSVLSKTYLRLNPNALVFSIKRKYVFPLCLKSPKFSLFIQKIYI